MGEDWTAGVAPASAEIACGSSVHTVTWQSGQLRLEDHDDPDAERALTALGGEPCPCVDLLTAWERHCADPRVLALGPRDRLPLSGSDWADAYRTVTREGPARQRRPRHIRQSELARRNALSLDSPVDAHLERLLRLDSALPHRFVSTVAAALSGHTQDRELWPALYAALHCRVGPSIEHWSPTDPDFVLEMTAEGDHSLTRSAEGSLVVRLPFNWIRDVWARELDVLTGEFVLSARVFEPGLLQVTSVDRHMIEHVEPLGYDPL